MSKYFKLMKDIVTSTEYQTGIFSSRRHPGHPAHLVFSRLAFLSSHSRIQKSQVYGNPWVFATDKGGIIPFLFIGE